MNKLRTLSLLLLMPWVIPAMAHVDPGASDQHLIEHLLIALAIALPVGYGLLRFMRRDHFRR